MSSPAHTPVAVVIMAKTPIAGQVKTRLAPALSPEEAASLYQAMLADRCAQVRSVANTVPAIAFAHGGGDELPVAVGFEHVPQPSEGGLGAGLAAAASHFLATGTPVVLIDSDTPTLPTEYLRRAVELVRSRASDVVIGPAVDGGYYLLGLSRVAPSLFVDIPWSTSGVVRATLERATQAGLGVEVLPTWRDVDTPDDLEDLEAALLRARWPRHTADWLRRRTQARRPAAASVAPSRELWNRSWHTLSSRAVYETPWLRLREDAVITPAGAETTYSVVDCGECVGVLPFVDDDTVLMVRQYRYVAGRVTWEMPTGGVHEGEAPRDAALRELAEEAQVAGGRVEHLCSYHTSKSVMDETAHLYAAYDLTPRAARSDEDEFIRAEPVPFDDVCAWVASGEIVDSMTIIAVQRLLIARARGGS